MIAFALAVGYLHLARSAEVIARGNIDIITYQQVGTHGQMLYQSLVPVVQS